MLDNDKYYIPPKAGTASAGINIENVSESLLELMDDICRVGERYLEPPNHEESSPIYGWRVLLRHNSMHETYRAQLVTVEDFDDGSLDNELLLMGLWQGKEFPRPSKGADHLRVDYPDKRKGFRLKRQVSGYTCKSAVSALGSLDGVAIDQAKERWGADFSHPRWLRNGGREDN